MTAGLAVGLPPLVVGLDTGAVGGFLPLLFTLAVLTGACEVEALPGRGTMFLDKTGGLLGVGFLGAALLLAVISLGSSGVGEYTTTF